MTTTPVKLSPVALLIPSWQLHFHLIMSEPATPGFQNNRSTTSCLSINLLNYNPASHTRVAWFFNMTESGSCFLCH
ncbi:hypothetical protein CHARACLAT_016114 [Characodon lateralis]|uniref:Uncharacterized protein n=1 Tax=Characodon lateralis TaxID=208331 RepID=A0ABU7DRK6_9TELE|nr:hypothetical protein [Characodon lateralis]